MARIPRSSLLISVLGGPRGSARLAGQWWRIAGTAIALAASCRSVQPLRGHSPNELKSCRGWMTEKLPKRTVARIRGQVRDEASPVPGVMLVLSSVPPEETPLFVEVTRWNGEYAFGRVPAGRYVLKTCFLGFDTFEVPIEIAPSAGTSPIDLAIRPSA
jgi:hypothetical protein